jgi:hypothetical protein
MKLVGLWVVVGRPVSLLENTPFLFAFSWPERFELGAAPAGAASAARSAAAVVVVATTLVPLHVAAHAEGLAATGERALEGLLARVRVAVDPQRAGPREGLVARLANVPVLALGKGRRC